MKRIMTTLMLTLFTVGLGFAQEKTNVLPQEARNFLDQHFSSATVEKVEKNDSWYNLDKDEMYEVRLSNGTKLDFNREGQVTEIDGESPIPEEALPDGITAYVKANYPSSEIVSWEKDDNDQEVTLSDGTELEFNEEGQFIKED